ncbi:COQ9 family protein, partial [Paracoccus liaowanqingii]
MTQTDRDALLEAALIHVPFEGMNDLALAAGARDIGMSPALARVHFPQGGAGLAAAYHRRADQALRQALA